MELAARNTAVFIPTATFHGRQNSNIYMFIKVSKQWPGVNKVKNTLKCAAKKGTVKNVR